MHVQASSTTPPPCREDRSHCAPGLGLVWGSKSASPDHYNYRCRQGLNIRSKHSKDPCAEFTTRLCARFISPSTQLVDKGVSCTLDSVCRLANNSQLSSPATPAQCIHHCLPFGGCSSDWVRAMAWVSFPIWVVLIVELAYVVSSDLLPSISRHMIHCKAHQQLSTRVPCMHGAFVMMIMLTFYMIIHWKLGSMQSQLTAHCASAHSITKGGMVD